MANYPVSQAIQALDEIKKVVVQKFGRNNEREMICDLVLKLREDLVKLQKSTLMNRESVCKAMNSLKDALRSTEEKVKKCPSTSKVVETFSKEGIESKLSQLRKDILKEMLSVVLKIILPSDFLASILSSNSVDSNDIAAIYAFHGPIRQLKRLTTAQQGTNETRHCARIGAYVPTHHESWAKLEADTTILQNTGMEGSSSYIFKAKFNDNNTVVIIKKFRTMDKEVKERFEHERELIQKLQHPNIIQIQGFCRDCTKYNNGGFCFISEYMPKKSMDKVIEKGEEQVGWLLLLRIIQGIAKGICYLHEENVVHLDLKPKNVLLKSDMTPVINNFGKAKDVPGKDGSPFKLDLKDLPANGDYVAPELSKGYAVFEQFKETTNLGKHEASTKSDVYSFGAILLATIRLKCAASKDDTTTKHHEYWAKMLEKSDLGNVLFLEQVISKEHWEAAKLCVIVGLLCCLPKAAHRPSMVEVVDMLGW